MNEIASYIGSVGFPIVACVGMGFFINGTFKDFSKLIEENNNLLHLILENNPFAKGDKDE